MSDAKVATWGFAQNSQFGRRIPVKKSILSIVVLVVVSIVVVVVALPYDVVKNIKETTEPYFYLLQLPALTLISIAAVLGIGAQWRHFQEVCAKAFCLFVIFKQKETGATYEVRIRWFSQESPRVLVVGAASQEGLFAEEVRSEYVVEYLNGRYQVEAEVKDLLTSRGKDAKSVFAPPVAVKDPA